MADTFEEMAETYHEQDNNAGVRAGDDCPKECDHELFEIEHDRDPESDVPAHPSYKRIEVVCVHHGIVATE